ncbi:ABC transporter permease [Metamycoplasma hyosynoviae]|uniref:ABC transporter permease subunit n=1 Tax=Metamycoplasma hyosynoviae TaxID=29559 RepID=A0A063YF53_9BACT|nr:ABC transporter permease subunit [Metamycoplasma hyosynoviae]ASI53765.1 spermidine/putrescine ABC transporter permease [Metamycoplasma hyosynoviae]KDE41553.1 spermidine/putrescine ABC transporter permease [Metamycoplasma hyosynoviae]KDE43000.1 spermidine/putrescine ABC transporter permease [Metamycoplasma hyosynoviae]KDE43367.1 spermidine/putrescine ABC transporter permease [Metamycoplasma hyosynoviae]KDE43591.1 spermidine/putrescine ABC transporter permease [Metamycoplasma hyosynoviae]
MSKLKSFFKHFYIFLVLLSLYIPIFFGLIYSFNEPSAKGVFSVTSWNRTSWLAYKELFSKSHSLAFVNSFLLGFSTSIIVIIISLLTVFAIWRQKNKVLRSYIQSSSNIPLINPDVITGLTLAIVFNLIFLGTLRATNEGFFRSIIAHTVMCLPYGILIMLPKSDKFSKNIFEASQDLGYSKFKTWFKTYFVYMLGSIGFTFVITIALSFDDFIITRIVSNTETLGTQLYEGQFQAWSLAIGAISLIIVILGNAIYVTYKSTQNFKAKKSLQLIKATIQKNTEVY